MNDKRNTLERDTLLADVRTALTLVNFRACDGAIARGRAVTVDVVAVPGEPDRCLLEVDILVPALPADVPATVAESAAALSDRLVAKATGVHARGAAEAYGHMLRGPRLPENVWEGVSLDLTFDDEHRSAPFDERGQAVFANVPSDARCRFELGTKAVAVVDLAPVTIDLEVYRKARQRTARKDLAGETEVALAARTATTGEKRASNWIPRTKLLSGGLNLNWKTHRDGDDWHMYVDTKCAECNAVVLRMRPGGNAGLHTLERVELGAPDKDGVRRRMIVLQHATGRSEVERIDVDADLGPLRSGAGPVE